MDEMIAAIGEVALTVMVIVTTIIMIQVRNDIREMKALLRQRLPGEKEFDQPLE